MGLRGRRQERRENRREERQTFGVRGDAVRYRMRERMVSIGDDTTDDLGRLEDLLTSVSSGIAPTTIVRKVRSLLDGDA